MAVATSDGVTFIDPATAGVSSTIPMAGGAHGMAQVTGIEATKLYVTDGPLDDPGYEVIAVGGDPAKNGPVVVGSRNPLPGAGTRVVYDDATQMVHILGRAYVPDGAATAEAADEGDWTVYVIEPHGSAPMAGGAVYADARLPAGLEPAAWALDVE